MDSNRSERRPKGGKGHTDVPGSERRRLPVTNRMFVTGSRVLPQLKFIHSNRVDFFILKQLPKSTSGLEAE